MQYLALATDYDGTLAHDGHVEDDTMAALVRLRESGRKVILVTGRELPDLKATFPGIGICDCVVGENGALLYWPKLDREEILAEPVQQAFIDEMVRMEVKPFSVGRVIFATWRPYEVQVLEAIQRLGLGYQIIFNKRAVMVLPSNVNKATGLRVALERFGLTVEQAVAVGDAENDHAFLDACGVAVAVSNALEPLKEKCDVVTTGDHGRGVIELIDRLLSDDLSSLGPRRPREKAVARAIQH
jgi:hydroxymethylpyrimidine pyrophosphatase-like HAD family hydrolase